nr:DUF1885 family protein [Thalassobacillus pellis]
MGKSAYIYLLDDSIQQQITLGEVHKLLEYYQEITAKTGSQLDWNYNGHAFPYMISESKHENGSYLTLRGQESDYGYILIGVGSKNDGKGNDVIQVTLPEASTHGDKNKGVELAKFIAKKLEGQLHLFNGRVMYYYKRKLS